MVIILLSLLRLYLYNCIYLLATIITKVLNCVRGFVRNCGHTAVAIAVAGCRPQFKTLIIVTISPSTWHVLSPRL